MKRNVKAAEKTTEIVRERKTLKLKGDMWQNIKEVGLEKP